MCAHVWMDMCVSVSTCVLLHVHVCTGYCVGVCLCVCAHTSLTMIENILTNC